MHSQSYPSNDSDSSDDQELLEISDDEGQLEESV